MRAKLASNCPGVALFGGSSANMSDAPDDAYDAVFVAQAFHWFANVESLREIRRVLKKPGGRLVLIWNLVGWCMCACLHVCQRLPPQEDRDKAQWVARLRDLYEQFEDNTPQYRRGGGERARFGFLLAMLPFVTNGDADSVSGSRFGRATRRSNGSSRCVRSNSHRWAWLVLAFGGFVVRACARA